jgi:hypothetical protein
MDLTRPNELSTMTGKEATKRTGRTRLWKRPRAPSNYTAEDNQLGYTVVFKGRMQCIQDGYQQHSETTRTRQGSQTSVYPSLMWSWIRPWFAPDSCKAMWKDQLEATRWWNTWCLLLEPGTLVIVIPAIVGSRTSGYRPAFPMLVHWPSLENWIGDF